MEYMQPNLHHLTRCILVGSLFVSLLSCSSGSTKAVRPLQDPTSVPRPPMWLIYDFTVESVDVRMDTDRYVTGKQASIFERREKGKAWADALSEAFVTELIKAGITARRATASTRIPEHAIAIKGRFLSINEGDRLKRSTIGFGAGAEEVSVRVRVYQQRERTLKRLAAVEAEAHGSKAPGVAGLVLSAGREAKRDAGMQVTVENLAKKLVERGINYYKQRGWL